MFAISFRIKLLLAMMVLVAGVTVAILYATHEKVQSTYLKLFQDQFEAEVNYFVLQQENRINPDRERCEELARLPALHEALKSGDTNRIYEVALNFFGQSGQQSLRGLRGSMKNNRFSGGGGGGRTNQYFRVLNANGEILHFIDPRVGSPRSVTGRKRFEEQLATVQKAMATLEQQPVGFLAPERTNGQVELLEVIVTKVIDSETKQTLGALVMGRPFFETSEEPMFEMSHGDIQSGIWVEGHIHSKTIPAEMRDDFVKQIEPYVKSGVPPPDTFRVVLGHIPRRVFFKLLNPESPFPPAYQVSLYSMAGALKTQNELRWQVAGYSAVALAAALVLSLGLAHGLLIPLRELVKGTVAIRSGDFKVKVPVRTRDEVGELAASFNDMADGLAQKELYRTVLNMVADEKVAHALMNGQLALGGEVREVSVLFCDIRGFTALTENMPPEDVIAMLNEHMTALTRVVKENNGVLDKFVGDLLMAIFGAPVQHEHDTFNAAQCALQLIQERERLNTTSRHQLRVGVGIATGTVVAGCMGSADRLNYTVLGERVNLASRLCNQAGASQVVIDQTTKEKLGENVAVKPLPALNLKGFTENVVAYELVSVRQRQA